MGVQGDYIVPSLVAGDRTISSGANYDNNPTMSEKSFDHFPAQSMIPIRPVTYCNLNPFKLKKQIDYKQRQILNALRSGD